MRSVGPEFRASNDSEPAAVRRARAVHAAERWYARDEHNREVHATLSARIWLLSYKANTMTARLRLEALSLALMGAYE